MAKKYTAVVVYVQPNAYTNKAEDFIKRWQEVIKSHKEIVDLTIKASLTKDTYAEVMGERYDLNDTK